MKIPDLNTSINTPSTTTSKNNFVNIVVLDSNGKVWGNLGFLKDKNTEAKASDAMQLFSTVDYTLSLEAPEREYTPMTFPTKK